MFALQAMRSLPLQQLVLKNFQGSTETRVVLSKAGRPDCSCCEAARVNLLPQALAGVLKHNNSIISIDLHDNIKICDIGVEAKFCSECIFPANLILFAAGFSRGAEAQH